MERWATRFAQVGGESAMDDAVILLIVLAAGDAQSFVRGMDCKAFEMSRLRRAGGAPQTNLMSEPVPLSMTFWKSLFA